MATVTKSSGPFELAAAKRSDARSFGFIKTQAASYVYIFKCQTATAVD